MKTRTLFRYNIAIEKWTGSNNYHFFIKRRLQYLLIKYKNKTFIERYNEYESMVLKNNSIYLNTKRFTKKENNSKLIKDII